MKKLSEENITAILNHDKKEITFQSASRSDSCTIDFNSYDHWGFASFDNLAFDFYLEPNRITIFGLKYNEESKGIEFETDLENYDVISFSEVGIITAA